MSFFSALQTQLDALRAVVGEDVEASELPRAVGGLGDDAVVAVIAQASVVLRRVESLRIAAAGVVAARSTRDAGHSGLAQVRGHRTPASFVQEITGSTKAEAAKHVRLGESLTAALAMPDGPGAQGGDVDAPNSAAGPRVRPWHAVLADALLSGRLTSAQHDVILRGLGEPPQGASDSATAATADAWAVAAEQLIDEASERTVEELARTARTLRDLLDPHGAERRFDERFAARSFRLWTDADGIHRAAICFDDHMAAWVRTIIDTALRPRRGGPRFVDPAEKNLGDELVADPRTNDQLTYDLIMDVLRAGALADAETVFGTRQAGVRVVITADSVSTVEAGRAAVGLLEDSRDTLPAWLVAQHACDVGTITGTIDRDGNPLDLGREARLFSPRQRLMLALRDGGCRWKGCDRPPSYCEAHHIDHYAQGGRTDIDRGILLCRFHHMQLHHGGSRIARTGLGDFVLHPPPGGGDPTVLRPRLALQYAWAGIDPPPKRFRPAA